jgi:hypothetical protein
LFRAPGVEGTVADQDRTNALLRKTCEGRFKIATNSANAPSMVSVNLFSGFC